MTSCPRSSVSLPSYSSSTSCLSSSTATPTVAIASSSSSFSFPSSSSSSSSFFSSFSSSSSSSSSSSFTSSSSSSSSSSSPSSSSSSFASSSSSCDSHESVITAISGSYVVAIPLATTDPLPAPCVQRMIHEHVHQRWGDQSLMLSAIRELVNRTKLGQHGLSILILKEMVRAEHRVALSAWDAYEVCQQGHRSPAVADRLIPHTPYTIDLIHRINALDRVPNLASLYHLVTDVMGTMDYIYLLDDPTCTTFEPRATRPLVDDAIKTYRGHYATALVCLGPEGTYVGHIYAWVSTEQPKTIGCMGIRSSILNLFSRSCRVGESLLRGVMGWARSHGFQNVQIMTPLQVMVDISSRLGFVENDYGMIVTSIPPTSVINPIEYGRPFFAEASLAPILCTKAFEEDVKWVQRRYKLTPAQAAAYVTHAILYDPFYWCSAYSLSPSTVCDFVSHVS